jgi:hypothetical protein
MLCCITDAADRCFGQVSQSKSGNAFLYGGDRLEAEEGKHERETASVKETGMIRSPAISSL